jgi:26S proteasome non-ATPase regulatory subunit 9
MEVSISFKSWLRRATHPQVLCNQEKKSIEEELEIYMNVIKTQGTDMTSPLVDRDGFPRGDIDVAGVRTARSRVHRLRNDLNHVRDAIASALQVVYARPSEATVEEVVSSSEKTDVGPRAFALVNGVAPGSPAEEAVSKQTNDASIVFKTSILTPFLEL